MFTKTLGAISVYFATVDSAWSYFVSSLGVRTVEKDTFRFDSKTGKVYFKEMNINEPYRLIVDGLVEKPLFVSYEELKSLPHHQQVSDFHCVEGWSVKDIKWKGIRFNEIFKRVKPDKSAKYITFHSLGETRSKPRGQGHYIESFPLDALLDEKRQILLAYEMNGNPLPHDHGAPLRVISPFDLAYKSIKFVHRIEFDKAPRDGWWTIANPIYPYNAPVPKDRLRS